MGIKWKGLLSPVWQKTEIVINKNPSYFTHEFKHLCHYYFLFPFVFLMWYMDDKKKSGSSMYRVLFTSSGRRWLDQRASGLALRRSGFDRVSRYCQTIPLLIWSSKLCDIMVSPKIEQYVIILLLNFQWGKKNSNNKLFLISIEFWFVPSFLSFAQNSNSSRHCAVFYIASF